jgi:hypothetical protein
MSDSKNIVPWEPYGGIVIPTDAIDANQIVPLARGLKESDKTRVISAFRSGYFDMAAEFVWRRSMSRLRSILSSLGMKFVGEMLGRDDIDEASPPDKVLTEYDTIYLAEALGVISSTGRLRLLHAFEILSHFGEGESKEEMSIIDAISLVRACVQYVLGEKDIGVAIDFSNFRHRLLSEPLPLNDPQVQQLLASPPFFLRTTLKVLLASVKSVHGATLERTLGNLNALLPNMWPKLPETDRWSVGSMYAEVSALGNSMAIAGLKSALTKVSGFDYVPEMLRSMEYKKAAKAVLDAHFSFNNFYAEPAPTEQLAKLGTVIPSSVLAECIQAYLAVYMGNFYNIAWNAAPIAEKELKKLTNDRWQYYLNKILYADEVILRKLMDDNPTKRFNNLVTELKLNDFPITNKKVTLLLKAASKNNLLNEKQIALDLWEELRGKS